MNRILIGILGIVIFNSSRSFSKLETMKALLDNVPQGMTKKLSSNSAKKYKANLVDERCSDYDGLKSLNTKINIDNPQIKYSDS